MQRRQWVEQVRELLSKAKQQQSAAFSNLNALKSSIEEALQTAVRTRYEAAWSGSRPIPYPIRRKHLLAQIQLKGKHYGLFDEIQAFVYTAGYTVIQELDNDQLEALNAWLARGIDNMDSACDSAFTPPAR